jgi:hypothetical protein
MDVLDGSFQTDLGSSATAFLPTDQPGIFNALGNAFEDLFGSISRQLPQLITGVAPAPAPRPLLGGIGAWPLSTWLLIAGGVYLLMAPGTQTARRRRTPRRRYRGNQGPGAVIRRLIYPGAMA